MYWMSNKIKTRKFITYIVACRLEHKIWHFCFEHFLHWEKNAIESIAFLSKSIYITDSNQYALELVTYLLILVVYFYEFIVYMLLEKNAFDSIAFFSQCRIFISII